MMVYLMMHAVRVVLDWFQWLRETVEILGEDWKNCGDSNIHPWENRFGYCTAFPRVASISLGALLITLILLWFSVTIYKWTFRG
ncbi:hypothetical protein GIB67_039931 [Kingdonia uniflora]|uniref:Uncharacterized protein n=1 Tax=Kingdonia uniflora TaxID=39325 RepID=A0A7J7P3R9_9MAGN|nr:hypothetical protein GIB67_039931 [Kingdonia uniflora]